MKEFLRRQLAALMRRLLAANSRPLSLGDGPVLVVAPHADDETLGCGGLIAAQAARGVPVHVVFVSDSAAQSWSPGLNRADRATQRHSEALAALATLGVPAAHAHFLNAPDGELDRLDLALHRRTLVALAETLRTIAPREIFLPFLGEGSTEHDAAVWLAHEALRLAGTNARLWEYPVWAWWNPLRLLGQLLRREENFRHDASAWTELRRRALACHASQTRGAAAPLPAALAALVEQPHEFYFRRSRLFP